MTVLTGTSNFPDELFRINTFFNGVGQGSVRYNSPTAIVLGTSDANRLVLNGDQLNYDPGQPGPWLGGTVTSITLWNRTYDKKIGEITGLNILLSDLGPNLGMDIYGPGGMIALLFGSDDTFKGSVHDDSFYGFDGNDSMVAGAGHDDMTPGAGNDTLNGGAGFDLVSFWNYNAPGGGDTTPGLVIDLQLATVLDPWGGLDHLISIENVEGTSYSDKITGNADANSLYGIEGNDELVGLGGNDFFAAGKGQDTIVGGAGSDMISYAEYVGAGSLTINLWNTGVTDPWGQVDSFSSIEGVRGTGNGDLIIGSDGDEFFQGMGGNDTIDGSFGIDTVSYLADKTRGGMQGIKADLAAGTARDGFGTTDTLIDIESVHGTPFQDVILGDGGDNVLDGNSGADLLNGRHGHDELYGGDGNDTLNGSDGSDMLAGYTGNDSCHGGTGHDSLYGGDGRDTLNGSDGSDTLAGQNTSDLCLGGSGDDWLYGGAGNDTLTGGSGKDGFVFDMKASSKTNFDKITDFRVVDDTIFLARSAFTKLQKDGLDASAFAAGTKAKDASDRIIYDAKSGALYYDPDGAGKAAQVKFAILTKHLKISNFDFWVY